MITPSADYIDAVLDGWQKDIAHLSSSTQIISHPAYEHLIAMGDHTTKRILERLNSEPDIIHGGWFAVLHAITEHNPIPKDDEGDMVAMGKHWLDWAAIHASWIGLPT